MSGYELRNINENDNRKRKQDEVGPESDHPEVVFVDSSSRRPVGLGDSPLGTKPVDSYRLVFIILLVHGIGTLMPWNMFINANDYFADHKLSPNYIASGEETGLSKAEVAELRKNFLSYLTIVAQVPNVIFNGLNLIVNLGSGNLKLRVNLMLFVEGLIFLLTIILVVVDSSKWPNAFFYITMGSVVVLNMASGVYQNCIFGTGAKFPGTYTNAILIGSNFSGTFTSTVNLLTTWMAPDPKQAALYYFITALFIIVICIVSYNLLPLIRFFRFYDQLDNQQPAEEDTKLESFKRVTSETSATLKNNNDDVPDNFRKTVDAMVPKSTQPDDENDGSYLSELQHKWNVFKQCWPQLLNVFLTFHVTLALFPAVLANTHQLQGWFDEKYFSPFSCFFIFNLFALIGNLLSGLTTWPGRDYVWILVVVRFLFLPFFLFCNFNPTSRHWPVYVSSDLAFIFGNVLLALSSGYLSSLCMIFSSSNLSPNDAPKAGMLAAFFLVFGIFTGVSSSSLLTKLVEMG